MGVQIILLILPRSFPLLMQVSCRYNLDPSAEMADQSLMRVLQKVQLWEKVSKMPDKLVSDSCHLFTIYEKVLIFLARALLNERTKVHTSSQTLRFSSEI